MKPNIRRALLAGGAVVLVVAAAAVFFWTPEQQQPPAPTQPARKLSVVASPPRLTGTWNAKVGRTPDTVSGGSQIALSGRFVLSGLSADDVAPTGALSFELYELKSPGDAELTLLEEWRIESEHLARFGSQEAEGFVMPLNLPWGSYRADIETVKLVARFKPAKGEELTHEATVTLDHSGLQTPAP